MIAIKWIELPPHALALGLDDDQGFLGSPSLKRQLAAPVQNEMNCDPNLMHQDVLARLLEDHRDFERLFVAIEAQCRDGEQPAKLDVSRLEAIRWYLTTHAFRHHAVEDRIYGMLLRYLPRFGAEIYDLREDHDQTTIEFDAFSRAVDGLKAGGLDSIETFCDSARAYIANERGHFIAEEEVFFPYAAQHLTRADWAEVKTNVPAPAAPPVNAAWDGMLRDILKA